MKPTKTCSDMNVWTPNRIVPSSTTVRTSRTIPTPAVRRSFPSGLEPCPAKVRPRGASSLPRSVHRAAGLAETRPKSSSSSRSERERPVAGLFCVDVAVPGRQAFGLSPPNWRSGEDRRTKADPVNLNEESPRRRERTRAPTRRVGCRPVPTGVTATTSRVTATERRARRARVRAVRRRRRLVALACLGIVAALIGRLAVTGGREAHAVSSRAALTARARAAAPVLPGPFHGYLLIADRGNNRMLLVDGAKRSAVGVSEARRPGCRSGSTTTRSSGRRRTGSSPTRRISTRSRSSPSRPAGSSGVTATSNVRSGAPGYLNTPDDAYLLPNGLVSVADAYNCRVLFISKVTPGRAAVRHDRRLPARSTRVSSAPSTARPRSPTAARSSARSRGSWIDDIGPSGRLRWAVQAPVSYPSDPQPLPHGQDPARRLRATGPRDHHGPPRPRALALRPGLGPGGAEPSLARGELHARADRGQRRLPPPRRVHQHADAQDRLAVRAHRRPRAEHGLPEHPRRHGVPLGARGRRRTRRSAGSRSTTFRSRVAVRRCSAPLRVHGSCGASASRPRSNVRSLSTTAGIVIAGGLDCSSAVDERRLSARARALARSACWASLPQPFHDAAGGGDRSSALRLRWRRGHEQLQRCRPSISRRTTPPWRPHLPRPLSDLVAATIGRSRLPRRGLRRRHRRAPRSTEPTTASISTLVGRLPVGLRYPAVSAADGDVFIAGGVSAGGTVLDRLPVRSGDSTHVGGRAASGRVGARRGGHEAVQDRSARRIARGLGAHRRPTPSSSNRLAAASTTRTAQSSAAGRAPFSVATSLGVWWARSGRSERGNV